MTSCRSILALVWPLAFGMVNNAVMQFVDRVYLARYSMQALEAVLPASILAGLFICFFQSAVGYAGVFVAQYHGAGEAGKCRASFLAGLALSFGFLAVTPFLVWIGNLVLAAAASSAELAALERSYYDIVMFGGVFLCAQTAAAAYFTGRGLTRVVFWTGFAGNLLNIALDPILIFGWWRLPALGIAGAAWATSLSMLVQFLLLLLALRRDRSSRCAGVSLPEVGRLAVRIARFGVPAACQSVLNLLAFAIFVFVTGGVGDVEMAVSNAAFTVNYLLIAPMEGFALGASTLVAQAQGRGDPETAAHDAHLTLALGVGLVAVLSLATVVFAHPILSAFAPDDAVAAASFHALGFRLFVTMAAWQVFDAAEIILSGALKGAGDTRFVMGWTLFGTFLLWLPLVFAVRAWHNTMGALWATLVVCVLVLCVGTCWRWRCGAWREIRLL